MAEGRRDWKPMGKRKVKLLSGGKVYSQAPRVIGDVVVKEWQRVPKQLLHDYTQKEKRPKPVYHRARCDEPSRFCARCVLPDPKKEERDIRVCPQQSAESMQMAEQYAALLMLHVVSPTLPLERRLPEPYASAWLSLGTDNPQLTARHAFVSEAERAQHAEEKRRIAVERRQRRERREMQEKQDVVNVFMSEQHRMDIENILHSLHSTSSSHRPQQQQLQEKHEAVPDGGTEDSSPHWLQEAASELEGMGFGAIDAREGIRHASQSLSVGAGERPDSSRLRMAALDWLVLHVPEHRLPAQFGARRKQLEVIVPLPKSETSLGEGVVSWESALYRLQRLGFPQHVCASFLDAVCADSPSEPPRSSVTEDQFRRCMWNLYEDMYRHILNSEAPDALVSSPAQGEDLQEMLDSELQALEAIYATDFTKVGERSWSVRFTFELPQQSPAHSSVPMSGRLVCSLPVGSTYPYSLPIITIEDARAVLPPSSSAESRRAMHQVLSASLDGSCDPQQSLLLVQQLVRFVAREDILSGGVPFTTRLLDWLHENAGQAILSASLIHPSSWLRDLRKLRPDLHIPEEEADAPPREVQREERQHQQVARPLRSDERLNKQLQRAELAKQSDRHYEDMRRGREQLPVFQHREEILRALERHAVTIIMGETGCGKSTQIPQFILEDALRSGRGSMCSIICTQPRRISAVSLAERVAVERAEKCGDTVGYHIRLESKTSRSTRLCYVTTGVLLRTLTSNIALEGYSHIVVDEVHERSIEIDFILAILRQTLVVRPDLKLVLMSATLEAGVFTSYFARWNPPMLSMKGRTFPVQEYFVEDLLEGMSEGYFPEGRYRRSLSDEKLCEEVDRLRRFFLPLVFSEDTLRALALTNENVIDMNLCEMAVMHVLTEFPDGGGILVFLPGLADITDLIRRLQHHAYCSELWLIPLHSTLSSADQRRVFESPPRGVRKVVVATNIAETSITVNDIEFVIDCGRMKEMQFDSTRNMSALVETWETRANVAQRQGRAGRVRAGHCYRLFSRLRFGAMESHQLPEIQRASLEHVSLQIKVLGLAVANYRLQRQPHGAGAAKGKRRGKRGPNGGNSDPGSDPHEQGSSIKRFLSHMPQPPSDEGIDRAIATLVILGALAPNEQLTPLGHHLALLPVGNVRIGKMLIYGAVLRCLSPVLAICGLLSERSPFLSPPEKRDEAASVHRAFRVSRSDHLTQLKAYQQWVEKRTKNGKGAAIEWAKNNFLAWRTLDTVDGVVIQFAESLADIGFLPGVSRQQYRRPLPNSSPFNANSHQQGVIAAVVCAGLYPNVLRVRHPEATYQETAHGAAMVQAQARDVRFYAAIAPQGAKGERNHGAAQQSKQGEEKKAEEEEKSTQAEGDNELDENDGEEEEEKRPVVGECFRHGFRERVFLHPSSVNFDESRFSCPWLVYLQMVRTSHVFVYDSSMVHPYGLLFFGGTVETEHTGTTTVDRLIKFRVPPRIAALVRALRNELDGLLTSKVRCPSLDISSSPIIEAVVKLFTSGGF